MLYKCSTNYDWDVSQGCRNRGLPLAVELQPYVANIGTSVFHNSVAPIFLAGLGTFITIFHTLNFNDVNATNELVIQSRRSQTNDSNDDN